MADSFRLVPPGQLFITPELGRQILYLGGQIFVMAVRIAAPIIAAVFMVDLSLGLIAKVAPQLHVLLLGFPIKIAVGFFFLGMVLVLVSEYVEDFVAGLGPMLRNLLEALGGGAGVPI
jgi:flagellar biosynthetic protein FliR